jgi:flavin-binding protein dodecin
LQLLLLLDVYWGRRKFKSPPAPETDPRKEMQMSGVYKITELVGTSPVSFAEAAKAAVAEAAKTVRHMDWLEVVRQSARIKDGEIEEFQVTVKIGFKIER